MVRQRAREEVAVAVVSHAVHEHGVDVELEAQREHDRTVSPSVRRSQDLPACQSWAPLAIAGLRYSAGAVSVEVGDCAASPLGARR
jgi:4'-phosphopantetheinyl transferase EntD